MGPIVHIMLVLWPLWFCLFGGCNSALSFDHHNNNDNGPFYKDFAEFFYRRRMMVEDNDDDRDNATGDDDDEDDYRDNDDDKVSFTPPCHKSKMTEAGVQRLIHGAGQILKHFTFYTHQIIADGLFGLRLSEIALKIIVDELPAENKHYSPLKKLYDDIKKLNNQVYNNVRQKENKYDIQFDKILRPLPKEFLRFPQLSLKDMRHFYEKGLSSEMSEVESDKCITQLLGTWSATNGQTCVTTKECLQVENQPHKKGYALTHQFLYFLSGIKYGCTEQLEKAMGGNQQLTNIMKKFAANIAVQLLEARNDLGSSEMTLDVHTEQAAMCAIFGIVECTDVELVERFATYVNLVNGCTELNKSPMIEKRRDKSLEGCSQHQDGLMIAYLSLALKSNFEVPICK